MAKLIKPCVFTDAKFGVNAVFTPASDLEIKEAMMSFSNFAFRLHLSKSYTLGRFRDLKPRWVPKENLR